MLFFYGVRHYGKSNLSHRYGICDACGSPGYLSAYVTARFLHLYWIPLIPVGHTKVIDLCPHCKKCSTVSPGKFKRNQKRVIEDVLKKLMETPHDPDLVIEAIGTIAAYNEETLFDKTATLYEEKMADNAQVLLAIAHGCFRLGRFKMCAELCRKAQRVGAEDVDELIHTALISEQNQVNDARNPPKKFGIPILVPYLVPLLIIFSILGHQGFKGFSAGKARELWLVNGSLTPYTIQLNDTTYNLKPSAPKRIRIPMGGHTVRIKGTLFPVEAFNFTYKLPFWKRLNDDNTLVLNPDAMAFLINEAVPYISEGSSRHGEPKYDYYFGKKWYVIPAVDYAFRDLPKNIDMYGEIEYKNHLMLYETISYLDSLNALAANGSPADLKIFSQRAMQFDAANGDGAVLLQIAKGTNELGSVENLERGLAKRPLLIEWHRFYQSVMEAEKPNHDLEAEYRKLVEDEPDIPGLKYLLGRVMKDQQEAINVLLASEKGEGCNGYGYHAVAYNLLCRCNFEDALKPAEQAVERNPDQSTFEFTWTECRLANKQYDRILKLVRENRRKNPESGELAALEIRYLCLQDKQKDAKQVGTKFITDNQQWMERSVQRQWIDYFRATRCYVNGDSSGYLEALAKAFPDSADYETALHSGNVKSVFQTLEKEDNTDFTAYLILYCAAHHHGDQAIAKQALDKILELTSDQPELLGILNGSETITPVKLSKLDMLPESKKLVACALAYQHPERQDEYFELAEMCNYSPFFPQHLINTWIAGK